jgi:hypothetical protein
MEERLEATLRVINELEARGLIERYAIGGAMALLFHTEPVATFYLDIFCLIHESGRFVTLSPIYEYLKAAGHAVEAEHILIAGVPVQFIPAYNALVTEAVCDAAECRFGQTTTRVIGLEHLVAIALQTGRPKDLQRVAMLAAAPTLDEVKLVQILTKHELLTAWNRIRSPS